MQTTRIILQTPAMQIMRTMQTTLPARAVPKTVSPKTVLKTLLKMRWMTVSIKKEKEAQRRLRLFLRIHPAFPLHIIQ